MTLRITITEEKDKVIMAPAGRIDGLSIQELQEGFEQVEEAGKSNIIVLLRDLEYINSQGVEAFLSFFKRIREAGGVVSLAEVPADMMELQDLLGQGDLAKVYSKLEGAVENSGVEIPTKEVYAGLGKADEEHFGEGRAAAKSRMPYLLAAAGVVIAVILVYLFLQPAKRAPGPEIALSSKLDLLERRVAALEGRGRAAAQWDEKVESLSKSLTERMGRIEKDLAQWKEDVESARKKAEAPPPPQKEQAKPKPASYHVVSKGETLFRIALRYNMTVEEVRRLNNLKPDQPIFIGQRLLVKGQ